MKIFFGSDWLKEACSPPAGFSWSDDPATGYGNLREMARECLRDISTLTTDASEADAEFFVGDPGTKPSPHLSPSIIFTMFEQDRYYPQWSERLNRWDVIITPSEWSARSFRNQLIDEGYPDAASRVVVVRLGYDPSSFYYMERPKRDVWTVLCQAVEFKDRKGASILWELTTKKRLPSDLRIWIKLLPVGPEGTLVAPYDIESHNKHLRIVAEKMPIDKFRGFLFECDFSISPSSGEGFGYIPLEHLATGMPSAMTHYSGVLEYARKDYFRPIKFGFKQGSFFNSRVAVPSPASVWEHVMWSYYHQDKVRELGREGSQWVASHWTKAHTFFPELRQATLSAISRIPRKLNLNRERIHIQSSELGITIKEA